MLRFKVGDIVKVKENLKSDCCYGSTRFVPRMLKYRGGAFTVKAIWNERYALRGCWNDDEEIYWDFSEEMLEPITDSEHPIMAEYTESPLSRDTTADLIKAIKSMMVLVNNSLVMQIMSDCLVALMALQEEKEEKNNG